MFFREKGLLRVSVLLSAVTISYIGTHLCLNATGATHLSVPISIAQGSTTGVPIHKALPAVPQVMENPTEQLAIEDQTDLELRTLMQQATAKMPHLPKWKVVRMRVTAYCTCPKCCGRFSDGITANLYKIRPGDTFVAADKRYAFGTQMIIPGYSSERAVEVKDRGRLIKGNRLDVFFNSHKKAQKWGARYLDVLVKEKP